MKPTLLVLAAGMGSRYGGLKQIDPVGPSGERIIDYSIYDAVKAGFGKVVFVIRKDIEKIFRETIGSRFEGILPVEYVFQSLSDIPEDFELPEGRNKPWGTGHAILAARDAIREPFAVINADDFYGRSGYELLASCLGKAKDDIPANYCMVGYELRKTLSENGTVARGVCSTDSGGFLSNVVEMTRIEKTATGARNTEEGAEKDLTGDEIVSLNLWGFTISIFEHLQNMFADFLREAGNDPEKEFFIPFVVDELIKQGKAKVTVLKSRDSWFGITYRDDKPQVVKNIRLLTDEKVYPEKLFK